MHPFKKKHRNQKARNWISHAVDNGLKEVIKLWLTELLTSNDYEIHAFYTEIRVTTYTVHPTFTIYIP